ncbi:MAG: hypothetical protein ACSNEK_04885 [Parachlamydiaceae bacterium]
MSRSLFFYIFFIFSAMLHADTGASLKYRTAGFFPVNQLVKHIYGDVIPNYQLEFSQSISPKIALWANADLFHEHGKVGHCGTSKIYAVNFSIGPKLVYPFSNNFNLYVGIGPNIARICLRNGSRCGPHHDYKVAFGGILKSGVEVSVYQSVFLDIFADYLYQPVDFRETVDIGGWKVGVGIGAKF